MVMAVTLIAQMETTTAAQLQLLTETQLLLCVLLLAQLVIMLILHYSYVLLATTLVGHALLPLHAILVLLQATES